MDLKTYTDEELDAVIDRKEELTEAQVRALVDEVKRRFLAKHEDVLTLRAATLATFGKAPDLPAGFEDLPDDLALAELLNGKR